MKALPALNGGIIEQIHAGFRDSAADDLRGVNLKIDAKRAEMRDLLGRLRARREELAALLARRAQLCEGFIRRFDALPESVRTTKLTVLLDDVRRDEGEEFIDNDWDGMG